MNIASFGDFARALESAGELHRVRVEVDPHLEVTEIAARAIREGKPAMLFERVKGSAYPVVVNALASDRRCELALEKHPEQLGQELVRFMDDAFPPSIGRLLKHRSVLRRLLHTPVRTVRQAISQEVVEDPDLNALPVLTCWPKDGGRFITLPQVVTYDPRDGRRNMGMYRMQVFDGRTTGMHWQIQKGGGFHFFQAEKLGQPLELAVAIGTDPALLLATVAPLPENMDEAMFAGFLRGKRAQFVKGKSISIAVPANAEFILEGVVQPGARRMEGPFGDHFGHYSHAAPFPVFHISAVTRRRNPVYPATVVGIPPMEDKFMGDATQMILSPLVKLLHSEIAAMWAYYEAGFHNLLVVAIEERYGKEAMKTALGLLGMSQLSLTKCIVLVSESVNVRNIDEVMKEIRDHFDPHLDFVMIPRVPLDTLDFTSAKMNLGSKMIIDATRKPGRRKMRSGTPQKIPALERFDRRIVEQNFVHETMLLVRAKGHGMQVLKRLLKYPALQHVPLVAIVSEDVDIHDRENYLWGVFTRFDCERDVLFSQQRLIGISPVYGGVLGIDATWKTGYPAPLAMTDAVRKKVDDRWSAYWQ
ncbi:MAG TPA: menaquinone biosynthesis decarboxylase [Bacteroidota bacterium]|nr:menaquinone biosynthesis decarboxylase [Bacteroidota bacterium]